MVLTRARVTVRTATEGDVSTLVRLNRDAYPDLVEQEVVFTEDQLRSHTRTFPRGQLVAEREGRIVGAIATLVLPRTSSPLAPHTWAHATDDGYFTSHDPAGDTLYLADVYVDMAAWGSGVGTALYGAMFDVARALRLRRIVAGGRLWGYHDVAMTMTPEQYAGEVVTGLRKDRVLTSQLKVGFVLRGILPHYLPDPKSCSFASLLEWTNPEMRTTDVRPPRLVSGEVELSVKTDNYAIRQLSPITLR